MASQEIKSPKNPTNPPSKRSPSLSPLSEPKDGFLSPRFRSAAAMAGWDEEALLIASLVVEDTPVRESRHKKRPNHQHFKSPAATNSNRKRRSKRQPPDSMPSVVLCLDDEEEAVKKDVGEKKREVEDVVAVENGEKKMKAEGDSAENASSSKGLPCMDRLREELSCAICLEICFEPSSTPCGHSFCKKCLKCAAAKCGKRCPKCRQLISNGRSCTVNTVLWNTIQLLFPDEIEARRNTAASTTSHSADAQSRSPSESAQSRSPSESGSHGGSINNTRSHGVRISSSTRSIPRSTSFITATQVSQVMERDRNAIRRRPSSSQNEDAALALRLQREEFMGAFSETAEQPRPTTLLSARANLRAMASRAYHIRTRGRY